MSSRLDQEIKKTSHRFLIASVLLLIAAIGLSVVWNRSIKDELADQAASFVRKDLVSKEMRGAIEVLNGVQFSAFSFVTLYASDGSHIITLPPVFDLKNHLNGLIDQIIYSKIEIPIYNDPEIKNVVARAVFIYPRFELVPLAFVVWLISAILIYLIFRQSRKQLALELHKEVKVQNAELLEAVAQKVRHNIRSPLASLRTIFVERMFSVDTIYDQGLGVINRLEAIIEELKPENMATGDESKKAKSKSNVPLFDAEALTRAIVSEKKLISKRVKINYKSEVNGVYTKIAGSEIKQLLSNLIDNSLQAIKGAGEIEIRFTADDASFSIEIQDNGCGIPPENLDRVFEEKFTYGDHNGSGLGLYLAKKLMDENFGTIDIQSEVGAGTTLSIMLPREATPSWHVGNLPLDQYQSIILCDDQKVILDVWEAKFEDLSIKTLRRTFSSCEELEGALNEFKCPFLMLVDYDLGFGHMKGLEFLKGHPELAPYFVLVTGHYDESWIQTECEELGCRVLPKDSIFLIS